MGRPAKPLMSPKVYFKATLWPHFSSSLSLTDKQNPETMVSKRILADLDFADDIVLLDENSESAVRHVTCLKETASVGLNVNF